MTAQLGQLFELIRANAVLFTAGVWVILRILRNSRKIIKKGGKVLTIVVSFLVNVVLAVGLAASLLGSAFSTAFSTGGASFAAYLEAFTDNHLVPWLTYCIRNHQRLLISKIIFLLKKPLILVARVAGGAAVLFFGQGRKYCPVFESPAPVFLQ